MAGPTSPRILVSQSSPKPASSNAVAAGDRLTESLLNIPTVESTNVTPRTSSSSKELFSSFNASQLPASTMSRPSSVQHLRPISADAAKTQKTETLSRTSSSSSTAVSTSAQAPAVPSLAASGAAGTAIPSASSGGFPHSPRSDALRRQAFLKAMGGGGDTPPSPTRSRSLSVPSAISRPDSSSHGSALSGASSHGASFGGRESPSRLVAQRPAPIRTDAVPQGAASGPGSSASSSASSLPPSARQQSQTGFQQVPPSVHPQGTPPKMKTPSVASLKPSSAATASNYSTRSSASGRFDAGDVNVLDVSAEIDRALSSSARLDRSIDEDSLLNSSFVSGIHAIDKDSHLHGLVMEEISWLLERNRSLEKELAEERKLNSTLQEKVTYAERLFEHEKRQTGRLAEQVRSLEVEVRSLKSDLSVSRSFQNAELQKSSELNSKLAEAEAALSTSVAKCGELQAEVRAMEEYRGKFAELSGKLDLSQRKDAQILDLESRVRSSESAVLSVKEDMHQRDMQIEMLTADIEFLTAELQTKTKLNKELRVQVDHLTSKQDRMKMEMTDLIRLYISNHPDLQNRAIRAQAYISDSEASSLRQFTSAFEDPGLGEDIVDAFLQEASAPSSRSELAMQVNSDMFSQRLDDILRETNREPFSKQPAGKTRTSPRRFK
eukprot:ANDGO_06659.mRNA.1 hypothetical protein